MNQKQHYEASRAKLADANKHFMELISDPVNPLTNTDLIRLVKKFPARWSRFAGFIGKLPN